MRTAFIRALEEVAEEDDRVMLVVGDLGYGVVEPFAQRFPNRYVNAGVAEQSMTGIATGMALSGNVVFTYSIANGIGAGFVSYTVLRLVTGRGRELHVAVQIDDGSIDAHSPYVTHVIITEWTDEGPIEATVGGDFSAPQVI